MIEGIVFLKFVVLLIFIVFTARIDADHFNKHQFITNHTPRFVQRGFFVLGLILSYDMNLYEALAYPLLFWALYDQTLNSMRKGVSLFYIGDTANSDSFARLYPHIYWVSKVVSLFVGIFLLYTYSHGR